MDILTKNNISLLRDDSFIHLDQGAHYTSPIFQKKFKIYNLEIYRTGLLNAYTFYGKIERWK